MLLVFVLFDFIFPLVYNQRGYLDIVNFCGRLSMMKAIAEVKALQNYS